VSWLDPAAVKCSRLEHFRSLLTSKKLLRDSRYLQFRFTILIHFPDLAFIIQAISIGCLNCTAFHGLHCTSIVTERLAMQRTS